MIRRFFTLNTFMISLLVTAGTTARAQQLTLDECIGKALENNIPVQNSRLDIENTGYQVKEAKSGLLPTIDVSGQYQYYMELPSQLIPASLFGGPEGEYAAAQLAMPQTTSAGVQLNQTLYDQRVMIGLRAARTARAASGVQLTLTKEDIIYNVSATYYNIQVFADYLSLLEMNIANLEKTVAATKALRDNEIVSGSTYKRLLINLENLRNQYENQKLTQTRNLNLLKYLMNMPLAENIEVTPFDYDAVLTELSPGDVDRRPDIRLQQKQIELSELDKKSTAAGFYPTLSAGLFYGYTGFNDEFAPLSTVNDDWYNSSYFSLSLNIPVFDGLRKRNQVKQKEVTLRKNINTLAMMKLQAERQIQDGMNNYASNKNLVANSKRSLDLAVQLFSDASIEYANGLISITELLDAQDDLSDARNNYSTALINLKLAELELKKANGELVTTNE